jgi:hypothetical protein
MYDSEMYSAGSTTRRTLDCEVSFVAKAIRTHPKAKVKACTYLRADTHSPEAALKCVQDGMRPHSS